MRVKLVHLGSEPVAPAPVAVGVEHRGNPRARVCVAAERDERAAGVGMDLDAVMRAEALAEIAREQLANLGLVVDNAQQRLGIGHNLGTLTRRHARGNGGQTP